MEYLKENGWEGEVGEKDDDDESYDDSASDEVEKK